MTSVRILTDGDKDQYDATAGHIIQSWQWGNFRQKEGKIVVRVGEFDGKKLVSACQITFHKIPKTKFSIGYAPKTGQLSQSLIDYIGQIAKEQNAIFVKFEPNLTNVPAGFKSLQKSSKTIFATNTILIDLAKSEEELLKSFHQKTRYNINLAKKRGVVVEEKNDDKSFEIFLKLQRETAKRQGFYIHPDNYYKLMWKTLQPEGMAHLLIAKYKKTPLVAWILFRFKDTLYYPYGGSSLEYKNFMAPNLVGWEAIVLGKNLNCKTFDFWGSLDQNPNPNDSWYGFHRFKTGYSNNITTYIGAYDLVINPVLYNLFILGDKLRWLILRLKKF